MSHKKRYGPSLHVPYKTQLLRHSVIPLCQKRFSWLFFVIQILPFLTVVCGTVSMKYQFVNVCRMHS